MSFHYCYVLEAGAKIAARDLDAADDGDAAARVRNCLETHPKISAIQLGFDPRVDQALKRPPAVA